MSSYLGRNNLEMELNHCEINNWSKKYLSCYISYQVEHTTSYCPQARFSCIFSIECCIMFCFAWWKTLLAAISMLCVRSYWLPGVLLQGQFLRDASYSGHCNLNHLDSGDVTIPSWDPLWNRGPLHQQRQQMNLFHWCLLQQWLSSV